MTGKRLSSSLVLVLALFTVWAGTSLAASHSRAEPAWLTALHARSDALNRAYRLGSYTATASTAPGSDWLRALSARSAALNQRYHLGAYAQTTATPAGPAVRATLVASTGTIADGFDWADASIGAVGGAAVAIAVGWLLFTFVVTRRKVAA